MILAAHAQPVKGGLGGWCFWLAEGADSHGLLFLNAVKEVSLIHLVDGLWLAVLSATIPVGPADPLAIDLSGD